MEEAAPRRSAASRATRTQRTYNFLEKHGIMPPLPYDWKEKVFSLQQLVELNVLSHEDAVAKAAALAPPAGDGEAAADAPVAEPDLSHQLTVYSQYGNPKEAKTEDWRTVSGLAKKTELERPDPPALFALPAKVQRGEIGQCFDKRSRP